MLYRHVCPKGPQKGRGTIRYTPEISREHLDRVRDHNVPSTNNLSLDTAPLTRTRTFTHKRAHARARTYTHTRRWQRTAKFVSEYVHTHIRTHAHTHSHTHTHTHTHTHPHKHTHTGGVQEGYSGAPKRGCLWHQNACHVCVRVCVCAQVCASQYRVYRHTHTYM